MQHWASLEDAITNGHGTERQFLCHVHGDHSPSASVNVLNGMWYCYACHASGKVDLKGIDLNPFALRRQYQELQRRVEQAEVTYPEGWLNFFDATGPGRYWLGRFSEAVCRRHRLGQTPGGNYATIPLRDTTGRLRGVIQRCLTDEDGPRYKYPYQAKLSRQLYNYHRADSDLLILTEGATDAIAVDEVAPGHAMAMYGSSLSKHQVKLIHRYCPKVIVVATDQDEGGELGYRMVRDRLSWYYPVIRPVWDTYKDLAAMPVSERADLVSWLVSEYGLPTQARVG